jgi:ketosteroid isomerase-like protein
LVKTSIQQRRFGRLYLRHSSIEGELRWFGTAHGNANLGWWSDRRKHMGKETLDRSNIALVVFLLLQTLNPALAQDARPAVGDESIQAVQKQFAEAYNRKDVDTMVAFFSENGVRITPNGIFQGRDAIRRDMEKALAMGLHDYSVRRTISRTEGNLVFNGGEWQAKLGDQQFHGYYSALLTHEGGKAQILEETVNIASPGR